jgi:nucleoside-diphosphate-sugar epimerase
MIRLLVTGASGFIGRHCLAALRSSDIEIHAVSSRNDARHAGLAHWHGCDLLDRNAASRLIYEVKPTHLLHLAWIATPGVYWTSPLNEDWQVASRRLAECFVASGGERMVVTGTCAEYDWSRGTCFEAEVNSDPASPYAKAKLELSRELAELASAAGIGLAWARLFWTYGPFEPPSRLVPSIIRSLLHDEPALCTSGTQRRDYLYVGDVARALAKLVRTSVVGPVNVASGDAISVASIATAIAELLGKRHLLRLGAISAKTAEQPLVVADVERLRNELGCRPQYSVHEGLVETIHWWREREIRSDDSKGGSFTLHAEGASIA